MELNTASAVIRFAVGLEEASAKFYDVAAGKHREGEEVFRSLAAENRKNSILVERAYCEVISDALEAGFSFEGIDVNEDMIENKINEDQCFADIVKMALAAEERIETFYSIAAEQSRTLMADIPKVLFRAAEKRTERKRRLISLLEQEGDQGIGQSS